MRSSARCHQPLAISHDVPTSRPVYSSQPAMSSRRYLPALFLLFVGSGCAALIYEIVWFQLLQPRLISARQHPLRVYAMLELGIGVLALLILVAMPLVGGVYTAWAGEGMAGLAFRAIIAGICLLPPTLLM